MLCVCVCMGGILTEGDEQSSVAFSLVRRQGQDTGDVIIIR